MLATCVFRQENRRFGSQNRNIAAITFVKDRSFDTVATPFGPTILYSPVFYHKFLLTFLSGVTLASGGNNREEPAMNPQDGVEGPEEAVARFGTAPETIQDPSKSPAKSEEHSRNHAHEIKTVVGKGNGFSQGKT